MNTPHRLLAFAAVLATAAASSQAGTFANINVVDGSASDWDSITDAVTDVSGDGSPIDIASVKIANDDTYIYLYVSFHTAVNPNGGPSLYLSVDTDNNLATGFNIYGLNQVGAEATYANDYPFQNAANVYNTGVAGVASTGTLNTFDAGAGIGGYSTVTTFQEYRLSVASTYTTAGGTFAVFPADTIRLMFWTDADSADTTQGFTYTLATAAVPEPSAFASLGGLAVLAHGLLRRRRRA